MPRTDDRKLIDSQGRLHNYLRVSITDRCDLGCFYCRPRGGFRQKTGSEILSDSELLRLAALFSGLGIEKIRLTGGEPLLRPGLDALIGGLKKIPGIRKVGLTTNGTRLAEMAPGLAGAGLDMVNISLDSLDPDRFGRITASRSHGRVMNGLTAALRAGFDSVKINMVVVRGVNDDEVVRFAALAYEHPLTVRFIEYMPFASNPWRCQRFISSAEVRERIEKNYRLCPLEAVNDTSPVSRDWTVQGGRGRLGFISALSDHFCGSCNRLRLTADGALKLCLYGASVLNLRDRLRSGASDSALAGSIREALRQKPAAHPAVGDLAAAAGRAMTEIGG